MFALGTFIANTGDRSDHANQIDFGVAMTLTQLAQDGSPLVRKVSKHIQWTCVFIPDNPGQYTFIIIIILTLHASRRISWLFMKTYKV